MPCEEQLNILSFIVELALKSFSCFVQVMTVFEPRKIPPQKKGVKPFSILLSLQVNVSKLIEGRCLFKSFKTRSTRLTCFKVERLI